MKLYLKKNLPDSEDWKKTDAFREVMADNNQYVDDPYVGLFWYDSDNQELFGVYSVLAEDTNWYYSDTFHENVRTCRPLHYALWQKGVNKGRDSRYKADYTSVPRGRVFEVQNQGFVVCVGHWIEQYSEAKGVILTEFQLPDDTEFRIDSHWDLGHGWSDKHF